jgi:hypothetical protein
MAAEALFSADAEEIIKVIMREAKAGANWACKLVIERVIPPERERPTPFQLPPISGPSDLPRVMLTTLSAVAAGTLTLSEGERIIGMLDELRAAFETAELAADVERLKERVASLPDERNGRRSPWQ